MGGGHSRELELAQQQVARLTKDLKKVSTELVFKESALAAAIAAGARSTAYLPLPLSVWVAEGRGGFALGCGVAFLVPFVVGCASNALEVQKAALTGKLPAKQK